MIFNWTYFGHFRFRLPTYIHGAKRHSLSPRIVVRLDIDDYVAVRLNCAFFLFGLLIGQVWVLPQSSDTPWPKSRPEHSIESIYNETWPRYRHLWIIYRTASQSAWNLMRIISHAFCTWNTRCDYDTRSALDEEMELRQQRYLRCRCKCRV